MNVRSRSPKIFAWPPDVVIAAKWIAVFAAIQYIRFAISFTWHLGGIFEIERGFVIGGDFVNDWAAARLTLEHQIMMLFDPRGYHNALEAMFGHAIPQFYNWSYPPYFIPWILWLGLFPYGAALALWLASTFALYAFAVARHRPRKWALTLILALSPASYANFSVGQNGFLSAALLVGGLRLLDARPVLAGVLFGCLSYKPQLGILVPIALLAARQWRAFASAAATALLLIGFSVFLFGTGPWLAYIGNTIPLQEMFLETDTHQMIFPRMFASTFTAARIWGASLPVAYGLQAITALGAIAAVIYAFRRCPSAELRNAVLLTATFLVSPYIFFYDMPILNAGIIATILAVGPRLKPPHLIMLAVAYILPIAVFPLNRVGLPLSPFVVAGLLGMQVSLMKQEKQRGHSKSTRQPAAI